MSTAMTVVFPVLDNEDQHIIFHAEGIVHCVKLGRVEGIAGVTMKGGVGVLKMGFQRSTTTRCV